MMTEFEGGGGTLLPKKSVLSLSLTSTFASLGTEQQRSFRQEDSRDNACRADHIVEKRQNFFFVELYNKSMLDVQVF